jgi:polar amino acid transport system substrate-binding protein
VSKVNRLKLVAVNLAACFVMISLLGCGDDKPKSEKKDKTKTSKKDKDGKKKSEDKKKGSAKKPPRDGPKQELVVAISPDIPPYVMEKATSGLQIDLIRRAMPDYELEFIQMPYGRLQEAIAKKKADVAVGVQPEDGGGHYSKNFITFANFAISKRADKLKIRKVADLNGYDVLAWQDAYRELGSDFERMFSPGGTDRENYREYADQKEQVRRFWKSDGKVAVIDRAIFSHFTKELGFTTADATSHSIFRRVTNFKAAFADEAVRDDFNDGLDELCESGKYKKLLTRYEVVQERTVCDR